MNAPDLESRLIPFSSEAEQSVIGGLLIDNQALDKIAFLEPWHFFTHANREIYSVIRRMISENKPVDVVTLAMEMPNEAKDVGGIAYLGELAINTPSAANIRRYAEIVVEKSSLRGLLSAATKITEIAAAADGNVSDKINRAQAEVMKLSEQATRRDPLSLREVLSLAVESIDRRSTAEIDGLMTGIRDLDDKLHGLKNGELVIIAARPAMGKSTLAVQIAEHVATTGKPALVLSQEMSYQQLADRLIASAGRVEMGAITTGKLDDDQWTRVAAAIGKLHEIPMYLDDQAALTLAEVCAKARMIRRKHGLSLLVVDYIQLMSGSGESGSRNSEIEEITRGLKSLAKELHIPVLALSQLSRNCEQRPNKRPMLSDLRDSGSIEQDADVVAFIYRDEVYNPDTPELGVAEIIIGKNRQGSTGVVRTVFCGEHSRFDDIAYGYEPPVQQPKRRRSVEVDL